MHSQAAAPEPWTKTPSEVWRWCGGAVLLSPADTADRDAGLSRRAGEPSQESRIVSEVVLRMAHARSSATLRYSPFQHLPRDPQAIDTSAVTATVPDRRYLLAAPLSSASGRKNRPSPALGSPRRKWVGSSYCSVKTPRISAQGSLSVAALRMLSVMLPCPTRVCARLASLEPFAVIDEAWSASK